MEVHVTINKDSCINEFLNELAFFLNDSSEISEVGKVSKFANATIMTSSVWFLNHNSLIWLTNCSTNICINVFSHYESYPYVN